MWGPCKRNPQSEQSLHIRQSPRSKRGPSHTFDKSVGSVCNGDFAVQVWRSKMPDQPTRHKKVVLATLAGVHIELRHARPKIPKFSPHAKPSEDPHIQAQTGL